MASYDPAAGDYDSHFRRRVDGWEDDLLASLLAPWVNGKRVLDLGCGTGWVLDHLSPLAYTGVDCSAAMLAELRAKHPRAAAVKADVTAGRWWAELPPGRFDTVTATWALEYLGDLQVLLCGLRIAAPGAALALHCTLPRGHRRRNFYVKDAPWRALSPWEITIASSRAGWGTPEYFGTGALPDALAFSRTLWEAALAVVPRRHHHMLALWRRPR